jgi:hypothetical protein
VNAAVAKGGTDLAGLKSSIGPELDVAVVTVDGKPNAVGFTQPKDEKTFDAQLDKQSTVHRKIGGWTAFADTQPYLDAVEKRNGSIADAAAYQAAMKTVPAAGDAIARLYASTAGLQEGLARAASSIGPAEGALGSITSARWVAAALTSQDGAFKLEVHAKSAATTSPPGDGLADEIPSGSIVALSLAGGGGSLSANVRQQLGTASQQLGFDVGALIDVLHGPVIAYVRPGLPLPEVTLAARPPRPAEAAKAVGGLIQRFAHPQGPPVPTQVDGGTLNKLDLGAVAVYYGVDAGTLVVTDSANALAELNGSVGHLSGDGVFKEAKDAAGMPDSTGGVTYVDIKNLLPLVEGFANLAGGNLPADTVDNLRPLRSFLAWADTGSGDSRTFDAFLEIK